MKAVILAGGLGKRLKPFTDAMPKALLPIGEKAILEIQIERLKKNGFDDIYLATNHKSEYIERFLGDGSRYGVKLTVSKELKPLGTVGPLNLIKQKLNEPFLVVNCDILSLDNFSDIYNFALKNKDPLTIAIKKEITTSAFGNISFDGDHVTDMQEKPDIASYIFAGIYVMKPAIFDYIPDNEYFGMDTLVKSLLQKKVPITKYELKNYWLDIGRIADYEKAQEVYNEHFK